jgi:hypothetical protein
MPGKLSPTDEKKWNKAKQIVEEQRGKISWPLVMNIYTQMAKDEDFKPNLTAIPGGQINEEKPSKDALRERSLNRQGRKTVLPHEVHEYLQNEAPKIIDRSLTDKQKNTLAQIKEEKRRQSEMKIIKSLDDLSNALSFLKDGVETLTKAKKPGAKSLVPFAAGPSLQPHEHAAVKAWTDKGFSDREALHMSGVRPEAPTHEYQSTPLSDSFLKFIKPIAEEHHQKHLERIRSEANPEHNPHLSRSHQSNQVEQPHVDARENAFKEFKASGALDGLSDFDKRKKIANFHKDFINTNKDAYKTGLESTNKKLADEKDIAAYHEAVGRYGKRQNLLGVEQNPDIIGSKGGEVYQPEIDSAEAHDDTENPEDY